MRNGTDMIAFCRRRGFTLVEMILSLAITGMLGLGVCTLLLSMSSATKSSHDVYAEIVRRQVLASRIGDLIRSSAAVLDSNADSLVLWTGDYNNNGKPNLSELRRLQWDGDGSIWVYETPDAIDAVLDVSYELEADYNGLTSLVLGTDLFPGQLVAGDVISCEAEVVMPGNSEGSMVRLLVTTDDGPAVVVATPRNQVY